MDCGLQCRRFEYPFCQREISSRVFSEIHRGITENSNKFQGLKKSYFCNLGILNT